MKLIDTLSITQADSMSSKDPNSNPYHNLEHCVNVYKWCEKILAHENKEMSIELQWATLFHDFDHTGGITDDNTNIILAINGFIRKYAQWCNNEWYKTRTDYSDTTVWNIFSPDSIKVVHDIINCTTFVNGTFPNEPVTLEQKAIRDADLLTMFLPDDEAIRALNGLYTELLINYPTMTREAFWASNETFFDNITWYTDFGKQKAALLSDRIAQLTPLFL